MQTIFGGHGTLAQTLLAGGELDTERAACMRRNEEMLKQLDVRNSLSELRHILTDKPSSSHGEVVGITGSTRSKRVKVEVDVQRRSARLAASGAEQTNDGKGSEAELGTSPKAAGRDTGLMTQEEYLRAQGLPLPEGHFRTDGHFKGWVHGEVAEKLGLAASAAEAWEQGGGGKFRRKIDKSGVPAHLRKSGWSDARAFAAGQLRKNPNAYFYRHTAPGQPQAQGEWTQEEHELFVKTARERGVGDKWGLFASYIPGRVGYQCSAYYTQVIIPSGLILDSRYRMDSWGDAVFLGAKGQE